MAFDHQLDIDILALVFGEVGESDRVGTVLVGRGRVAEHAFDAHAGARLHREHDAAGDDALDAEHLVAERGLDRLALRDAMEAAAGALRELAEHGLVVLEAEAERRDRDPRRAGLRDVLRDRGRVVGYAIAEQHDALHTAGQRRARQLLQRKRETAGEVGGAAGLHRPDALAHRCQGVAGDEGGGDQHRGVGIERDDGDAITFLEPVEECTRGGAGLGDRVADHRARGVDHDREVDGRSLLLGELGRVDPQAGDHAGAGVGRHRVAVEVDRELDQCRRSGARRARPGRDGGGSIRGRTLASGQQ
ncbi:MAG: hypothetical protein IPN32_09095 [Deltaproteobacteria bacterium]|nr:hypothetical protein [Deltaproteobacteria bacterium]